MLCFTYFNFSISYFLKLLLYFKISNLKSKNIKLSFSRFPPFESHNLKIGFKKQNLSNTYSLDLFKYLSLTILKFVIFHHILNLWHERKYKVKM